MTPGDQQAPRSSNEILSPSSERPDNDYLAQIGRGFERELTNPDNTDGARVREIIAEHETEETIWEKIGSYLAEKVEGFGTKIFEWFIGTRVAQFLFGEQIRAYNTAQEALEAARQGVDAVIEEGSEFISENLILAGLGTTLVTVTGIAGISSLLGDRPRNPFSALRMLKRVPVMRLLRFGAIGAIAYSGYRLYEHLQENPELLSQIPESAAEQREWIVNQIQNLGLEGLSAEEIEQHANDIASLILGEATLEEIQARIAEIGESNEDQERETNDLEGIETISLSEAIERTEANISQMLEPVEVAVQRFRRRNEGVVNIAGTISGLYLLSQINFNSVRSFGANSISSIATLAKIPLDLAMTSNGRITLSAVMLAAGGIYYIREDLEEQARQTGQDIMDIRVPANPREFAEWIRTTLERKAQEGEEWIQESLEEINNEELNNAVEYITGAAENITEIDPRALALAARESAFEEIESNEQEQINRMNIKGFTDLRDELSMNESDDFAIIIQYLNESIERLSNNQALSEDIINGLIDISQNTDLYITLDENEGVYQWALVNWNADGHIEPYTRPYNLCIDPTQDTNTQFNISSTFVINERSYLEWINIPGRDARQIARQLHEFITDERGFLSIQGDDLILHNANEAYVMGPLNFWGEVIDELSEIRPGGEEFQPQEVFVEWGDMIMPAIFIGSPLIITDLLRGGIRTAAGTTLRVATAPISLPWQVLKFSQSEYRSLIGTRARSRLSVATRLTERVLSGASILPGGSRLTNRIDSLAQSYSLVDLQRYTLEQNWSITENMGISASQRIEKINDLAQRCQFPESIVRVNENSLSFRGADGNMVSLRHNDINSRSEFYRAVEAYRQNRGLGMRAQRLEQDIANARTNNAPTNRINELEIELRNVQAELHNNYDSSFRSSRPMRQRVQNRFRNLYERTFRNQDTSSTRSTPEIPHSSDTTVRPRRSRTQTRTSLGTHAPDIDVPRHTGFDSPGLRRRTGLALGAVTIASTLFGASHIQRNYDENLIDTYSSNPDDSDIEQSLDVLAAQQEVEQELPAEVRINNYLYELGHSYDDIGQLMNPAIIRHMTGDEFYMQVEWLADTNNQQIARAQEVLTRNYELFHNYLRERSGQNQDTAEIEISPFLRISYDSNDDKLSLIYDNESRFKANLYDNYDLIKYIHGAEQLAGIDEAASPMQLAFDLNEEFYSEYENIINNSSLNQTQKEERIANLVSSTLERSAAINADMGGMYAGIGALNVAPAVGSAVDATRVGNTIARGQFGRAALETGYYLAGAFGDLLSFGSAGTGIRAGRQARWVTRLLTCTEDTTNALVRLNNTNAIRTTLARSGPMMDAIIDGARPLAAGMILGDVARSISPLFIRPNLRSSIEINPRS